MPARRRPQRLAGVLLVTSLAAAVSGCGLHAPGSDAPSGDGPLGPGTAARTFCVPKDGRTSFVIGTDLLDNHTDRDVTIDDVVLVAASGVRLVEARVAGLPPSTSLLGGLYGRPPRTAAGIRRQLRRGSQPAAGVAVQPHTGHHAENVLLYLAADDPTARSDIGEVDVAYHEGTRRFVWHDRTHYVLQPGRRCATSIG